MQDSTTTSADGRPRRPTGRGLQVRDEEVGHALPPEPAPAGTNHATITTNVTLRSSRSALDSDHQCLAGVLPAAFHQQARAHRADRHGRVP
jgi:hypothetical protein